MSNKKKAYLKLFILLCIVVILPIVLYLNFRDTLFNIEWLKNLPNYLQNYKSTAGFVLAGLQILQVIICILPGQPIQFASSYMYGVAGGLIISLVGAIIGSTITFYIAKILGYDALKNLFGEEKVENYRNKINSGKGLLISFFIYLIPGFPKDLVAYVAGISRMQLLPFLIVSTIGRTPGMLGSLFFGTFFQNENYKAIILLAIVCIIFLAICFIKRKSLINILDNLEEKDLRREAKHNVKSSNK